MKRTYATMAITYLLVAPIGLVLAESTYCPQGHALLQIGMSETEVLGACGQPTRKMTSQEPLSEKIPVTQLIYTGISQPNSYPGQVNAVSDNWYPGLADIYSQWSLPKASNESFKLEVDIINDKISAIRMNGGGSNAMSMCAGEPFQIGDDLGAVYASCGSPETTNTTYKNAPIPSKKKPEIWIYEVDQYSPKLRLTFIDGKLQSIN